MFKVSLFCFLFSLSAFADRSVSIVPKDGRIDLINPSTATVSYTYICYSQTGATVASGAGNLTTHSDAKIFAGGTVACTSGSPSNEGGGAGVCDSTTVSYANASSLCHANSHVCTIDELNKKWGSAGKYFSKTTAWIAPNTSISTAWSFNAASTWSLQNTSGKGPTAPTTYSKSNYRCRSSDDATVELGYCGSANTTATLPALCCSNGATSCKVTITGSDSTKYLQSPQYKSGAAF